jgi:mono/diheme cytochrome c family protein
VNPSASKSVAIGVAALVVLIATWAFVQMRSQAIIQARHPLPPSAVKADMTPEGVALGQHLVEVSACGFCHGPRLAGRMLGAAGGAFAAPNLTRAAGRRSDAELDRAIRAGLRPDGTTEFAMPSQAYAALTDRETAAILGYLRQLKPESAPTPRLEPALMQQVDIAVGFLRPEVDRIRAARPPLDLGPATSAGRHLAMVACSQCHGTDLAGGHGAPGPDLMVRGGYSRAQFQALMRKGETVEGRDLEPMSQVARASFSHFTDAEIDQVYAYLDARDVALAKPPPAGGR